MTSVTTFDKNSMESNRISLQRENGSHPTGESSSPSLSSSSSSLPTGAQHVNPTQDSSSSNGACGSQRISACSKSLASNMMKNLSVCGGRVAPFMLRPQVQEHLPDGSARFKLGRYAGEMLDSLNALRLEGSLCDVTLRVASHCVGVSDGAYGACNSLSSSNGDAIHAHKVILAGCSLYFRGMFARGMREAGLSEVCIRERNVTAASLRTLVDFAYTGEVLVTQDNVQDLLVASIFLEVRHVIEACTLYLEQQLEPANCVGMMEFARAHGCLDLETKARRYVYEHFCDVAKHDEILELPAQDMADVVQQEDLNVNCESEVFAAVVRWAEHAPDHRLEQLGSLLMNGVRLSSLAPAFLENQLKQCHLIQRQPKCYRLLLNRLRKLTMHAPCVMKQSTSDCAGAYAVGPPVSGECSQVAGQSSDEGMVEGDLDVEPPPRRPGGQRVIYSAGGIYRKAMDSLKSFECYDPSTREWTRLPDLPRPRCGPGVTALLGRVYVVGGRVMQCGGARTDTCSQDCYDPRENKWSTRCHMTRPRSRVGVAVLDGMIYAIGGSAGMEHHKSVERYIPSADKWEQVADMHEPRVSPGVAVVNRLIYVVGGYDGQKRLANMECYHPERGVWENVMPMQHARSGAGVAVLQDRIYVVGGFDGTSQLKSVERFDPVTGAWEEVAPLLKARSGVAVGVIDDTLYVLGGFDGSDFLSCVESYNPHTNTWQRETNMLCERSGHGVTVERMPTLT